MWHHHGADYGADGMGFIALTLWTVVVIDLVLLGIWLWQKIDKKK